MANFLIYNGSDTDEPGRITQSNKVLEAEGYSDILNEHGLRFVALDRESFLPPETFVVQQGEVKQRSPMPVSVDRTSIKAGGLDAAKITGIPDGATIVISLGNMELERSKAPSSKIDLPIPVPCTYHVHIELWPWLPFDVDITAS